MKAATIEQLYAEVTESLLMAERLEGDGDVAEAAAEYVRVSMLEEQIAECLPADDEEGAIARRGAVSAAIQAGTRERALDLAARYLEEGGSAEHLERLGDLEREAKASSGPSTDIEIRTRARFRFRDHAA
mgnify:CR=1 FL=1